jgi:hypothetical protein
MHRFLLAGDLRYHAIQWKAFHVDSERKKPENFIMEFSSLVDALRNPQIYPEKPVQIELVQTHISAIFFAGEHVYKVKKPVNFGFLDFTTLEKRSTTASRKWI